MQVDLSLSAEAQLVSLPSKTQEIIREAEGSLQVKKFPLSEEKNDDGIVLSYAFYKGFAHFHNLTIPTYRDVWTDLRKIKKDSILFMAYEGKIPVATLWVGMSGKSMVYLLPGSTQRGVTLHADYFLVWEAMKEARAQNLSLFAFSDGTLPSYPQVKKLHNSLIRGFTDIPEEESSVIPLPLPALPRRLSVSKLLATLR